MRIKDMNWMQVETYLKRDDRAVLPVGSTEQHAQLSLMVDCILSERVAVDAAEPLGVPVFPPVNYGITPYFRAFPGTISLRLDTFLKVVRDILDSMADQGFRRIVIVNGHGGNSPASTLAQEWMTDHPGTKIKFHNWYNAPKTWAKVKQIDPIASHASWMENFTWTRLPGVVAPSQQKPMIDYEKMRTVDAKGVRALLGDGNFGGYYERSDEEMDALWAVAVEETRTVIDSNWA
ncbi:MAG TPA: creatininase family protein [Dongiaceae bacterium]